MVSQAYMTFSGKGSGTCGKLQHKRSQYPHMAVQYASLNLILENFKILHLGY